ncbi:hypothetical protein M422DRAFT_23684 [Sphaerobolus stellatus SS14]|nr:hypothetical protein M422DRAFT_23684 [Sphaerobolus stellatus SS14]
MSSHHSAGLGFSKADEFIQQCQQPQRRRPIPRWAFLPGTGVHRLIVSAMLLCPFFSGPTVSLLAVESPNTADVVKRTGSGMPPLVSHRCARKNASFSGPFTNAVVCTSVWSWETSLIPLVSEILSSVKVTSS